MSVKLRVHRRPLRIAVLLAACVGASCDTSAQENDGLLSVSDAVTSPGMSMLESNSDPVESFSRVPVSSGHGVFGNQLDGYRVRAEELPIGPDAITESAISDAPVRMDVWWEPLLRSPLGLAGESLPVDVGGLVHTALTSSPYVRGVLTEPQIRRSDLVIADAQFDTLAFVDGKFADTNEPIGSLLTTGTALGRFRDEHLFSSAGLRKQNRGGSTVELVQRGGFQQNNSTFLVPNPQGTTRLEANFTQPLMRDRGVAVNTIRVTLAQIDLQLATSEVRSDLEEHLVDVARAYWSLYQARADFLQRKRLLERAVELSDILHARGGVDTQTRQIIRSKSAVASRRSDLIRSETAIRNAQSRLRLLTGSTQMIQASRWELLPVESPLAEAVALSTRQATITALDNRPDITQSIRKVHATSLRVGVARNQVLPRLDLILSGYVAGLDANRDTFGAFGNQFTDGRPSYAAGMLFERPVGNRAAEARLNRNRWEMTRALHEFQQTAEEAFTDVEIAVRETHTSFNEMIAKKQSIDAAAAEVDFLMDRWRHLPDPNESAVLLIEDLLDAQERLADEERSLTAARVSYAMSWVQLRRAMGVLLRIDDVLPTIAVQSVGTDDAIGPPIIDDVLIEETMRGDAMFPEVIVP